MPTKNPMVPTMVYPARIRRYRGSKRRVAKIRYTSTDRWFLAFLAALGLLSVAAGAWLSFQLHP